VQEAVGCGPVVLLNGNPLFQPESEGFSDPKVLQLAGARSAVGFTADRGTLLLVTTRGARVRDMGGILKALGCTDGMNLDGGASSGLYYRGTCLIKPGRLISNALVVVEK
jgi:exopolysaccharide biosynthesis protein